MEEFLESIYNQLELFDNLGDKKIFIQHFFKLLHSDNELDFEHCLNLIVDSIDIERLGHPLSKFLLELLASNAKIIESFESQYYRFVELFDEEIIFKEW